MEFIKNVLFLKVSTRQIKSPGCALMACRIVVTSRDTPFTFIIVVCLTIVGSFMDGSMVQPVTYLPAGVISSRADYEIGRASCRERV